MSTTFVNSREADTSNGSLRAGEGPRAAPGTIRSRRVFTLTHEQESNLFVLFLAAISVVAGLAAGGVFGHVSPGATFWLGFVSAGTGLFAVPGLIGLIGHIWQRCCGREEAAQNNQA